MACVKYCLGMVYTKRICEELESALSVRHPSATVDVVPFVNGRETSVMLRCRQLESIRPRHMPIAWVYEERSVGALEVVLGN